MREVLRTYRGDVIAFLIAQVLYLALVLVWSFGLRWPDGTLVSLSDQKDLIYSGTFVTAALYALLATRMGLRQLNLPRHERRRGFQYAVAAVVVPLIVAGVLNQFNTRVLLANSLVPDIAIPAMQLIISLVLIGVSFFFAVRGSLMPGKITNQAYIRLGIGLMFIPLIGFLIHLPLTSDWRGPVRGVVLEHALMHGLFWGIYFGGLAGTNFLDRPSVARPAGRH